MKIFLFSFFILSLSSFGSGIDYIIPLSYEGLPLFKAVEDKDEKKLNYLIEQGIDVNKRSKDSKDTVLHLIAAQINGGSVHDVKVNLRMAKALIKAGADVDLKNNFGNTPLHIAVDSEKSDRKFIELLLKRGADIFLKNHKRISVKFFAKKDLVDIEKTLKEMLLKHLGKTVTKNKEGSFVEVKNNKEEIPLLISRFLLDHTKGDGSKEKVMYEEEINYFIRQLKLRQDIFRMISDAKDIASKRRATKKCSKGKDCKMRKGKCSNSF